MHPRWGKDNTAGTVSEQINLLLIHNISGNGNNNSCIFPTPSYQTNFLLDPFLRPLKASVPLQQPYGSCVTRTSYGSYTSNVHNLERTNKKHWFSVIGWKTLISATNDNLMSYLKLPCSILFYLSELRMIIRTNRVALPWFSLASSPRSYPGAKGSTRARRNWSALIQRIAQFKDVWNVRDITVYFTNYPHPFPTTLPTNRHKKWFRRT